MPICVSNSANVLSRYYQAHGQIRPDAFAEMHPAPAPTSPDAFEALMHQTEELCRSPRNVHSFRPQDGSHPVQISGGQPYLNEDLLLGEYTGDVRQGKMSLTKEDGPIGSQDRRVERNSVFFQGDQIVAFHGLDLGDQRTLTVDFLDRREPDHNRRFELAPEAGWLSEWTSIEDLTKAVPGPTFPGCAAR